MGVYESLFVIGLNHKTMTFSNVPHSSTVADFKKIVSERSGIPEDELRLVYAGKQLENDKTLLEYYNIQNGSNIHCIIRCRGGAMDNLQFRFYFIII